MAAIERAAGDEFDAAAELVETLPRCTRSTRWAAELVVGIFLGSWWRIDAEIQSHYERFLASGRHPALRPVLRHARVRVDALLTEALHRCGHGGVDVDHLVAVLDGTAISALVEGNGSARSRALAAVTAALERDRAG